MPSCHTKPTPMQATSLLGVAELGNPLLDASLPLGQGELLGLELERLLLVLLLGLFGLGTLGLLEGVLTDSGVGLGVDVLKSIGVNVLVDVLLELALVALLIVVGEGLHVLGDVATEDVLLQGLAVQLLALNVESGETVLGVGDEDATVRGTLHGAENTGTGGGAGKTNVEVGLEGAAGALVGLGSLGEGELTLGLLNTGEVLVEAKLLEDTAGDEQAGGVGGSPVGQTVGDAVGLELVGVGRGEDLVTRDLRGDDLHDDVAVGEAHHQAVLGRIVLVLGLGDQPLTGIVVGLSLLSALVLGLEAAKMGEALLLVQPRLLCPKVIFIPKSFTVLTCSTRCS
ncbi:hypothetical protein ACKVWL_011618 [Pyricularia oryzae]